MPKKIISSTLKIGVTVGLFLLLFRPQTFGLPADSFGNVTPLKLWDELRGTPLGTVLPWLLFALIVKLAGMFAGVLRWQLLLKGQGLSMPLGYMIQSWFVGRTIGIFLPGTIGLDGYRLYDSSLYTKEPLKCLSVIAVEKLIGFISLTFLVLMTFPLGFRLLNVNVGMLAVILTFLACFVAASFLLLLNPRVIQVLVAILPTPPSIRNKIDKLGASITAYSGNRLPLVGAVLLGVCVHVGTCFMYFGTMMAIRAENTNILDVFFASPLMIYGTVLGPSIGGEGIREIVFATLLGAKSGVATAVLFAHLGWWVGDLIPFLIGLPIFIMRKRPDREAIEAELREAREHAAQIEAQVSLHLSPAAVADYRRRVIACAFAGIGGGLVAGAFLGFAEALWLKARLTGFEELTAFWWGPLVYGIVFAGVGLGVSGGLCFLYLLFDRFAAAFVTFALALGGSAFLGAVIARFRYTRDVLEGHPMNPTQLLTVGALFLCVGLVACVLGLAAGYALRRRRAIAIAAIAAVYLGVVSIGGALGTRSAGGRQAPAFAPAQKATGPSLILIAADALRADYLKLYKADAVANTPNLDALAQDGVNFKKCISQASWTKPAFASIFTSRYPESHRASKKASALPLEVSTLAEVLRDGGYYTKGFANNPNITAALGFDQGFVSYEDLKPDFYFGARYSASNLALYQVLRKVRNVVKSKLTSKLSVTDFYQPAATVTQLGLEWLDGPERPTDAPFLLFLHYMDSHDPFMNHAKPGVGYARNILDDPDPDKFLQPMVEAYNSEIEHMDTHIGAFLDGLRERGLYENALIVFTSDHGEEFYDHEGWWHGQSLFDELTHVPLIVKLPGGANRGASTEQFGRHIDIAPTLIQFAGLKPADDMWGKSLFTPEGAFANADIQYVYSENDFENNVLQSVRTQDAKVIRANEDNPRRHAPLEMYDLTRDPLEKENIAGQNDPRQGPLDELVGGMIESIKSGAAEPVIDAGPGQNKEQLEALGYM